MKFSCEKSLLQNAAAVASRAAAIKSAVPSLEGLLLEAGENVKITGYDLKTGIVTSVPADVAESGDIVLNARLFGEIIRKLPDDIVSISVDENLMTRIECGMSEFNIMGIAAADYPELPAVDQQNTVSVEEKTLKAMIAQTNFAVSDNEARPIHTGALFEVEKGTLTMVAVDGYRLALRREELEESQVDECSFVVPGAALAEVEKISAERDDKVNITLGTKHVIFSFDNTRLITRRLVGEFLNYRNSIPSNSKFDIEADRRAVIDAVERVSLIISDKLKSPVRCVFGDNVLKVVTNTALGRASDECEIKGSGEGLEIGFNNKYILDALRAAPSDKIVLKLSSGVSPCIMVPADDKDNFIYMILPVRLKANEG